MSTSDKPQHRRLLVFGTYDERLHPRVAVLRDGLRDRCWEVNELNRPLGATTADKVRAARSILGSAKLVGNLLGSWTGLISGRRGLHRPDVVLVGYMGQFDIHLARLLFPHSLLILDHMVGLADTVKDRGLGGGFKYRFLEFFDRWANRRADVVLVDTESQLEMLPPKARIKALAVPVGATEDWYRAGRSAEHADSFGSPPSESVTEGTAPLTVVFYGLYTPLQGAVTMGRAIAQLASEPGIKFTMIGSGQDLESTQHAASLGNPGTPNVEWIDWVDAADLPELVARHDVCLGIFGDGPKAQRVIPNKVYQGFATGCAVVTGDTAAMAAQIQRDTFVAVAPGDHTGLVAALKDLHEDRGRLERMKSRALEVAERFRPLAATEALDRLLNNDTQ